MPADGSKLEDSKKEGRKVPPFLSAGFRPFFLLAGLWAIVVISLSLPMMGGGFGLPLLWDPVSWHAHEMLFGYVAAAMAGFLLTAIPNWTGRPPCAGLPLLALAGLWLAARLAGLMSALFGSWVMAGLDLAFLLALLGFVTREVVAAGNLRNLPVCLGLGLFLLAGLAFHGEQMGFLASPGVSERGGLSVVLALLALIGGRITPAFSRNWLTARGSVDLPGAFGPFDGLALAVSVIALLLWTAAPESDLCGTVAAVAAVANILRLLRWKPWLVRAEPLLWSLHLAIAWVAAGFLLLALSVFLSEVPRVAAVHAFAVGAMGTMTLAVMSRATLGHSGRPLRAGWLLTAAFVLVFLSALARVGAALAAAPLGSLMLIAAGAWVAAFAAFLVACGPILLRSSSKGEA